MSGRGAALAAGLAGVLAAAAVSGCGAQRPSGPGSDPVPGTVTTLSHTFAMTTPVSDDPAPASASTPRARRGASHRRRAGRRRSGDPRADHRREAAPAGNPDIGRPSPGAHRDPVVPVRIVHRGRLTPGASGDDKTITGRTHDPCRLVPAGRARALTGGRVRRAREAPLGPTCVYTAGAAHPVTYTLALETTPVPRALRVHRTTVDGRAAFCPGPGAGMLYLPLGEGRALHVVAPCAVARRLAAAALARLS